jgi:hypothetical protein
VRAEREKRERIHREEVEMLRRENASLRSTLSSKTSEVHGHGIELQTFACGGGEFACAIGILSPKQ